MQLYLNIEFFLTFWCRQVDIGRTFLSLVSMTPAKHLSIVSLTQVNSLELFGYFWMVLTTLAINCWPVSTPPPITFSSAIKCINREAFSFCKSANRVARMRTTAICLELLECHLVQTKTTVFSLVASGASDQDVWGLYGCNFSWRFQWHHWRP